jgi:hypothetical protein
MEAQAPQGDRTAARAGDAAHEAGMQMIQNMCAAKEPDPSLYPQIPTDDYEAAYTYALIVMQYARTAGAFAEPYLLLEKKLECNCINGVRNVKPDAVLWDVHKLELHVFDLKTGYVPVRAERNQQLAIYALVLTQFYGISLADERVKIFLHIVQPKNYLTRSPDDVWEITPDTLVNFCKEIDLAALAALEPDAPCVVGGHCKYCRARGRCETFGTVTANLMTLATGDSNLQPTERTPSALAAEADVLLMARTLLEQREAGIIMEIEELLRKGQRVPRYEIKRGFGRETWNSSDAAVAECLKQYGAEPMRLATPYQVRQSELVPENMINLLTTCKPGKAKLQKINTAAVAAAFEK